MAYNPVTHHRRSVRLKGYDYTQAGAYFVTIVTQGRECLFGEVVHGEMWLNDAGRMVEKWWLELNRKFSAVDTDEYVVMPNHIHGVIVIAHVGATLVVAQAQDRAGTRPAPTLGDVVGAFKSLATHEYIVGIKQRGWPSFAGKLWQRNYHEHIIRDESTLHRIREYIVNNPLQWAVDRENPRVGATHASPLASPLLKDDPWRV